MMYFMHSFDVKIWEKEKDICILHLCRRYACDCGSLKKHVLKMSVFSENISRDNVPARIRRPPKYCQTTQRDESGE